MENSEVQKNFWAGVILFNPDTRQILMQKRDDKAPVNPNRWAFFGGVGETGENPQTCLLRELQEELGLDFSQYSFRPLQDYLPASGQNWRYTFLAECQLEKSQMVLGEGESFDWISYDQVLELDLTTSTRKDAEFFLQTRVTE